ncbi:MAG: DUF2478 domain-containing protein [Paracoccaceae bacterium]
MTLGYVLSENPGETDRLLSMFASLHQMAETAVVGVVQSNVTCKDANGCDMDALVLPDGPTIRISQSLGKNARGCRLDPAALEQAVSEVQKRLLPETELLIVNKFGKHEADGRGFLELIAHAICNAVPVLTAVNQQNLKAFLEFSGDCAVELQPNGQALLEWFDGQAVPAQTV